MNTVYKITCTITGKVYFGWTRQSLEKRFERHCRGDKKNCYLQNCIQKYGRDNFVMVEVASYVSPEEAMMKEIMLIEEYQTNMVRYPTGIGMNMTDGGEGTYGYIATALHRQNLSKSLKGKKKSDTHADHIRQAKLGDKNPMFGKQMSDEQKEIRSEFWKQNNPHKRGQESHRWGKKQPQDVVEKRRLANSHQWLAIQQFTPDYKTLIRVFQSISEAAKTLDLQAASISRVCKGGPSKTHGGFGWRYVTEPTKDARQLSDDHKQRIREGNRDQMRPVEKIDLVTGEVLESFECIAAAASVMNMLNGANIAAVCKGKRKSTGGYGWRYQN
jgi:group I intron endonuclease